MEANCTTFRTLLKRLILVVPLCVCLCSGSLFGQVEINNSPLPVTRQPFLSDSSAYYGMHKNTSKTIVALQREADPRGVYAPLRGTGFFIRTDPKLPYYCLITDGHNLDSRAEYSIKDLETRFNLSFGVVYLNDASSRVTPINYEVAAARPVSVTIADARVYKNDNTKDWIDYAVIKVPKNGVMGIPFDLHGIEFLNSIPMSRINANDRMKSMYVIHHADLRPQQFTSVVNYLEGNVAYIQSFSLRNFSTLSLGASGAPLVLPRGAMADATYSDAPAIGFYTGVDRNENHIFQKLSTIESVINKHCKGEIKKDDQTKSTSKTPNAERSSSAENIIDRISKLLNDVKGTLSNLGKNYVIVGGDVVGTIRRITNTLYMIKDLREIFKNGQPLPAIRVGVQKLDHELANLDNELNKITLNLVPAAKPITDYELKQNAIDGLRSLGRMIVYAGTYSLTGHDDLDQTTIFEHKGFNVEYAVAKSPTHSIQMIETQISSLMENLRFNMGFEFSMARRKRDNSSESLQMQAPEELKELHRKIVTAAQYINQTLTQIPGYNIDDIYFFQGVEFYFNNVDEFSNRYLLENFYSNESSLSKAVVKGIEAVMANVKKTAGNYSYTKDFSAKCEPLFIDVIEAVSNLEKKHYPRGFIYPDNYKYGDFYIEYKHYNLEYSFFKIPTSSDQVAKFPQPPTWKNLLLNFGAVDPNTGNAYIEPNSSCELTKIAGQFQPNKWFTAGLWYSTRFRLTGTFDIQKIALTYDPLFKAYLDRNSLSIKSKGKIEAASNKEPLTHLNVFNKSKLPAVNSNFLTDFKRTNYTKTVTDNPVFSKDSINYVEGPVKFEIESPELLVLARALKLINTTPAGSSTGEIKFKTDPDIVDGLEDLGENFTPMHTWAERWLRLKYQVVVNKDIQWTYTFPFITDKTPDKRLSAASESISAEDNTLPTLQPNPVSDQLQLNLPEGYEQSEITITNITGARMKLPMQTKGNTRLIDVRSLQTGVYFILLQSENKAKRTLKFLKQ